ncbi:MAG: hypothetical protein Athens071416_86 [Parcubacteria group bacterium Athens0714_16]|nr:MAG: hypothetical protein Athens071416_86 [Parcubacteria group bacterium Athens0714_16]
MKFSELLKIENTNIQTSFVLGMIYAHFIILNDNKILAYSAYIKGKRSKNKLEKNINEYYYLHKKKLENFLGDDYEVILNKDISRSSLQDKSQRIKNGVSIVIENDLLIPNTVDLSVYIYGIIEKWLIDIDDTYKTMFFTGAIDARGSLDFNHRFISMDIIEKTPMLIKRKLTKYNDIIGAVFNYNPRLVQKKSFRKNDQFRLPLFYYISKFGLFTPFKIDYYKSEIENNKGKLRSNFFFVDEQYKNIEISEKNISNRNLKISNLSIKLQKEGFSFEEKRKIIEEWKKENFDLDTDDEILFSSQNMKEFSKKNSNYLCEYNNAHMTFNSKSNNKNYVEAHHLIPFSERKRFDVSIDITENIICLCPNCHRKIHLAVDTERKDFIKNLFENRKKHLEKVGIIFDLEKLFKWYKIKLE